MIAAALPRASFAGFSFDRVSMESVVAEMASRSPAAEFAYAVTPNVDHAVRLDSLHGQEAQQITKAYGGARWVLCDSRTLAALAWLRGLKLPIVPGSDLTARLFATVISPGDTIAIIGGDERTLTVLRARYPDVAFVQHIAPMGLRYNEAALVEAASFGATVRARFIFIVVGSPQQELVAIRIAEYGEARGIGLCVGASIDFLTGRMRRAPRWMQKVGLEWSHRLLSNPRRLWRRYLVDGPRILPIAFRHSR